MGRGERNAVLGPLKSDFIISMASDDLADRVLEFVHRELDIDRDKIRQMDLVGDDGEAMFGDEVSEFMTKFSREFGVNVREFRWYHHTAVEGFNPLWLFVKPWWAKKTYIPIYYSDLVESARRGEWTVEYPENERQP
jgi:hypothetical protein